MVGERLLQHLVHHLDVAGHRETVLVGRHPPYPTPSRTSPRLEVLGPRVMFIQVRTCR